MITRRHFNAIAGACAFMPSIAPNRARAQGWPTHPVRLIVPFAAGGPTDVIGRIVGERLSKTWGQQVLIENRPGGGTNIANENRRAFGARRAYNIDGRFIAGDYSRPVSLAQL